jgi:hypothetical protein
MIRAIFFESLLASLFPCMMMLVLGYLLEASA